MAGKVGADLHLGTGHAHSHIVPRCCPATRDYWTAPSCAIVDKESGHFNLCPFLYGLQINAGGTVYDLRGTMSLPTWLTSVAGEQASFATMCLRKESAGTEAGAKLRP